MAYPIERNSKMTLWERIYLPEVMRGMFITARHFIRNFIKMGDRVTVSYPEERKALPPGYRAEHRLMRRPDGTARCTACMLCATICPANCIRIEAEEADDPSVEKRARSYEIDILRCVFCGLCVEACPCDAIRMDSGKYDNAFFDRSSAIYGAGKLLSNGPEGGSPLSRALY